MIGTYLYPDLNSNESSSSLYGNINPVDLYNKANEIATDLSDTYFADNTLFYPTVERKISEHYFSGGPCAAKSFSDLVAPIYVPKCKFNGSSWTVIKETKIIASLLWYLESIPVLGTALAIILASVRDITTETKRKKLEKAVKNFQAMSLDATDEEKFRNAAKVFNRAVKYVNEENLSLSSIAALIPFVKPIVGLMNTIDYYYYTQRGE